MKRKKEGFTGQWYKVLPDIIQSELNINSLTKLLHITDIGYYPKALHHFRQRKLGCPQHILIYCVEGKGTIWIDTEKITLGKDQYFIIPANYPHSYSADTENPWSIYWVHFSGTQSAFFVDDRLRKKYLDPSRPRFKDRISFFEDIYHVLQLGYSNENLEYSSICLWHMLGSFNYLSLFQRVKEIPNPDRIERSIQYMETHLDEKISLSHLANQANLSVPQYSKLFRVKTSQSPIDYFLHLKIQKACQYLDFSTMKVNEIAQELAFEDPFYFSRIFKKVMGMSPSHFRNRGNR